jgi:calcineurin-like phosphoesterase family protein
MIWFTADQHYNHKKIIEYCSRPFSSIEEMNEFLISLHNNRVKPGDTVWNLGDFGWWGNYDGILSRLNGEQILVRGSHDRQPSSLFAKVVDVANVKFNHETIFVSHYAHARWPHSHHGRIHLFGHSHGKFNGIGKSMDVGVDVMGFAPISFEKVIEMFKLCASEDA